MEWIKLGAAAGVGLTGLIVGWFLPRLIDCLSERFVQRKRFERDEYDVEHRDTERWSFSGQRPPEPQHIGNGSGSQEFTPESIA